VHACLTLAAGDVVSFAHSMATGQARVIWRRLHPQNPTESECGFFVQR
jgi:hypothetical protein